MTGNPALNVVLVEVGRDQREVLRQACVAAGYSPVFKTLHDACTDRLDRWADLVVVGSDLGFRALRAAEEGRAVGPRLPPPARGREGAAGRDAPGGCAGQLVVRPGAGRA